MTEYTIVIEDAGSNFSAYVVGLDGCVATGQTLEEVETNLRDAIQFHLEGMRLDGGDLPSRTPIVRTVPVASYVDVTSAHLGGPAPFGPASGRRWSAAVLGLAA